MKLEKFVSAPAWVDLGTSWLFMLPGDWALQNCKDTDIKARVRGMKATVPTFDFIFGCKLGVLLLRQTDNLSRTLQSPKLSAAEGNSIAQDVIEVLCEDRNEHSFNLFWDKVLLRKGEHDADDPKLQGKGECLQNLILVTLPTVNSHQVLWRVIVTYTSMLLMRPSKVLEQDSMMEI